MRNRWLMALRLLDDGGVDGGLNPRISGDEAKIGTEFAVQPLAARWPGALPHRH
jgi:hypothetical protein